MDLEQAREWISPRAPLKLKTELRRLKVLGCEATAKGVTLHLRDDTPLDPAKLMKLMSGKQSPYKLSPDMRLSRRSKDGEAFTSELEAADKVLADLAGCLRDSGWAGAETGPAPCPSLPISDPSILCG